MAEALAVVACCAVLASGSLGAVALYLSATTTGLPAAGKDPKPTPRSSPSSPSTSSDPLNPQVLDMLKRETGIGSKEAWENVFLLVSKGEHDNQKKERTFLVGRRGQSVFGWAAALPYDWTDRGVTMGLIGFTTAYGGRKNDAKGQAMRLFRHYKSLGGEDLSPLAVGATWDKSVAERLVKKVESIGDDPRWILAQWQATVTGDGPIHHTVQGWKSVGVAAPSALAIATIFDASLNQGTDGVHGGVTWLKRLAVRGNEDATLREFNKWRRTVAGTNNYNATLSNGRNRADTFEKLRVARCFSLQGCSAAIADAISWRMG